jgi:CDP-glucose 4,6-dehydratase
LLSRGSDVTALVRDGIPGSRLESEGNYRKTNIVRGSLEELPLIERTLNEYEIECIFHLGAQTIIGAANRSPLGTFDSNIKGTWNILESSRLSKMVKCVVVASSDKVYGDQKQLPYTEDTPLFGRNPYDVSKICADLLAQSYASTYGLPIAIARCGNLFGGGDLNFNRLIPGTIRSLLEGKNPVIRSDGSPKRDYLYVKDAVRAYITLAENIDRPEVTGKAFNFGTNTPLNPIRVGEFIIKMVGNENLKLNIRNTWSGEIHDQYLDSSKSWKVLRWKAEVEFNNAISETISWYKEWYKERELETQKMMSGGKDKWH